MSMYGSHASRQPLQGFLLLILIHLYASSACRGFCLPCLRYRSYHAMHMLQPIHRAHTLHMHRAHTMQPIHRAYHKNAHAATYTQGTYNANTQGTYTAQGTGHIQCNPYTELTMQCTCSNLYTGHRRQDPVMHMLYALLPVPALLPLLPE